MDKDFQYPGAINLELAERYAMRWHESQLEKRVRNDAAAAARTATQVQSTFSAFEFVLSPGDQLALAAARATITKLAGDLKALKPWAKAYATFERNKDARERELKFLKAAAERWSSDAEALVEARDMMDFYSEGDEGIAVEAFIQERHRAFKDVLRDTSAGRLSRNELSAAVKRGETTKVRRYAAEVLGLLGRGSGQRETWFVSRDDYEAWLQARQEARRIAANALVALRSNTTSKQ